MITIISYKNWENYLQEILKDMFDIFMVSNDIAYYNQRNEEKYNDDGDR